MGEIKETKRRLEGGVLNGEWFEIIYHGGSNPGARRTIAPIAVFKDKVRARCYTSNSVKPFMLAKIEIIEVGTDASAVTEWSGEPKASALSAIHDVRDVWRLFRVPLADRGWQVEMVEYEEGWQLQLFGFFKNGNRKRSPTHVLSYDHTTSDASYTYDPEPMPIRVNLRPRVKPWSSRLGTFKRPEKPVTAFLNDAGLSDEDIERIMTAG